MKKIVKLMLVMGLGIFMIGCSTQESSQESTIQNSNEGYPITIDHAFGQTVIESKPEKLRLYHGEIKM